jgi:hypothetical protein
VSATETPQGNAPEPTPTPAPAPERHCRRCGATLGPDQEWCLACGAAAETDVVRPRGWRLPLVLAAVVVLLAIAAAVLAIAELSKGPDKVAQAPTPTPTVTPVPTASPTVGAPENEGDQPPVAGATASPSPGGTVTPAPGTSATPTSSPGATATATPSPTGTIGGSSFPDWPAGQTAWTVILESAKTKSQAESVARDLQSKGDTVGILNSSDHSSLNPGYWVVYSGQYSSKSAAQSAMSSLPSKPADAYVRKVSAS